MTRARGQASRSLLNREFQLRVVVHADDVRGRLQNAVHTSHDILPEKYHSLRQNDQWCSVCWFASSKTAEAFQLLFGGELVKS